jgi:hypothetical protein
VAGGPAAAAESAGRQAPDPVRQAVVAATTPGARPTVTRDPDPHARATKAQEVRTYLTVAVALDAHAAAVAAAQAEAEAAAAAAAQAHAEAQAQAEAAAPPAPAPPPAPAVSNGGVWDSLAQCESGGNWATNTGNGYYGGLQFSMQTWQGHGGSGLPHQNSRGAQIAVAERVQASQGWGAWPSCASKLGLR